MSKRSRRSKGSQLSNRTYQEMPQSSGNAPRQIDNLKQPLGPGVPILPFPNIAPYGPWQFDYPSGYNTSYQPRQYERISFHEMKEMAERYEAVKKCENFYMRMVEKLRPIIKPRPELVAQGLDAESVQDDIQSYLSFFEKPDRQHDLHWWIKAAVRDRLRYDAIAIFINRTNGGDLVSLDLIDGSTIKPVLDLTGRTPQLPYCAYQVIDKGVVAGNYAADDFIYSVENPRTDSPYGVSRLEIVIERIEQALRKRELDTAKFTDGSIPAGVITLPSNTNDSGDDLRPSQIQAWQDMLNARFAGNNKQRQRIQVLLKGMQFQQTEEVMPDPTFDKYLETIVYAAYGLNPTEMGNTENANRAISESQENALYRQTILPIAQQFASIFTTIIRDYFHDDRFIFAWENLDEKDDFNAQSASYVNLVKAGILSPQTAAELLGLPISNQQGQSVLIEDKTDSTPDDEENTDDEEAPIATELQKYRSSEWKQFRECVLNDLRRSKPIRNFEARHISQGTMSKMQMLLKNCASIDEAKFAFKVAQNEAWA